MDYVVATSETQKKTYLILHGYRQSADVISKKVKGLFPKDVDLVIPNGPLIVDNEFYGWFPLERIDLVDGVVTINAEDIIKIVSCNISGKYDAVIAFSQGCLAAGLLIGSGKVTTHKLLLFSPIPVPSLWPYTLPGGTIQAKIYIGARDTLVSGRHSLSFLPALGCNNIEIVEHRWGHVIPSTKEYKLDYNKFINSVDGLVPTK